MAWPNGRRRPSSWTWTKVCRLVRMEAGGRCARPGCLRPGREVDHIVPYFEGGTDTLDNAELLCLDHHNDKTQAESHRAIAAKRARGFRAAERHPLDYE